MSWSSVVALTVAVSLAAMPAGAQPGRALYGVWQSVEWVDEDGGKTVSSAMTAVFLLPSTFVIAADSAGSEDITAATCVGIFSTADSVVTLTPSKFACPGGGNESPITMTFRKEGDYLTIRYEDGTTVKLRRIGGDPAA